MISETAIFLGAFGTGLLALDVVKPKFLRKSRDLLSRVASHDLSPLILFKSEFDEKDHEAISVIKAIGFYVSLLSLFAVYIVYQPSDELIQRISYYPASSIGLMVIGYYLPNVRIGGWLIATGTYMVTPLIFCFLFTYAALLSVLQLPIKLAMKTEEKWLGEDQAPRFLGYGILFISFILQFIALKS
ncbi:hypothetical protein [Thalassotalea euphylliae]|uniref:Uncharacterized protein n=1 Tax=Thalassotalea euphylliae TaxID=1655234 RepID=A0A3E0TY11_9GAMM|nr:hypothetical protein [Thalassotalea euphylliae]REL29354.1 hypothetical protein DXX94_00660 [Thalassotalea euphylliae]